MVIFLRPNEKARNVHSTPKTDLRYLIFISLETNSLKSGLNFKKFCIYLDIFSSKNHYLQTTIYFSIFFSKSQPISNILIINCIILTKNNRRLIYFINHLYSLLMIYNHCTSCWNGIINPFCIINV